VVERLLARVTDCIVTISPRQRDEIVGRWRVAPAARVQVVPLGLELGALLDPAPPATNLRRALGLEADDFVVGYVGRFVPIKDLPTLLEGFAAALARLPRLRLVLVGDGPLRQELADRAGRLGISRAIRFAGWRRDLPAVYASLDLVVLTSLNEGTPVALIEAMAAGRAVVATDVGGVADVVTDGHTGLLVPAGNPARLAEVLVRLASDPDERSRLGAAARASVGRFRAERLVDDIWDLYRDGLSKKRGVNA
jgi:glycosyltransferase involved in cell wall biosynthesis